MLKKILITFLILIIAITTTYLVIYYIPNFHISSINYSVQSDKIDKEFDSFEIIAFSDLKIKSETDLKEFDKVLAIIDNDEPNVVLFLGDVFAKNIQPSDELIAQVEEKFKSINAPYGKFAVLGDTDLKIIDNVYPMLFDSNFEVLEDKSLKIYNGGNEYINLVGMSINSKGNYSTSTSFSDVTKAYYTITLCHYPNLFSTIENKTDLFLTAQTLGGERVFPILGPDEPIEGIDQYWTGVIKNSNSTMIISNGIGEDVDYRILANKNIVRITFNSNVISSTIDPTVTASPSTVTSDEQSKTQSPVETSATTTESTPEITTTEKTE